MLEQLWKLETGFLRAGPRLGWGEVGTFSFGVRLIRFTFCSICVKKKSQYGNTVEKSC